MSVLEEILEEEYVRSVRLSRHLEYEFASLPKGSIRERQVKGHTYYYLNYRVGGTVKSDYIPASEVDGVRAKVQRRKKLKEAIKEQEISRKQIERALGRKPDVD